MISRMKTLKFKLTSEQLELLLYFENSLGLNQLAQTMGKDPSVISRNLQRIAENYPVLKKIKGRYELTPFGQQVNKHTKTFLENHIELFASLKNENHSNSIEFNENSVLILINTQKGLQHSTNEERNNLEAEENILKILNAWRAKKRKIIHIKHISENINSLFFKDSDSSNFINTLSPLISEQIIEKTSSSAFFKTKLNEILSETINLKNIILVGFTANDCIDATARDASSLGFNTFVVSDATATFDLREANGKLVKAEKLHQLVLTNINAFYANVINTSDILQLISLH